MATQMPQQNSDPQLKAAFRQHLPRRLKTLLRRARAQCRSGWDCNVLRSLHDEIGRLAGACGRYGMLEIGERLLALESAMAPAVAAHAIPDAATSNDIDRLLDSLRPRLQRLTPEGGPRAWLFHETVSAAARDPFPRCDVPPPGYESLLGVPASDSEPEPVASGSQATKEPSPAPAATTVPELRRGPRVSIVDDDDPLLSAVMLGLDQQDCDATWVDGLDGLAAQLYGAPPDLAVLIADPRTHFDALATALKAARDRPENPVRLLVLLREPDVELRLRALRIGADRCIALPAASEEVLSTAQELVSGDQGTPYRVLIVEDDEAQSLFVQAILRRAGMETRALSESLPVLEELDRFQPDLLLLDLNMPDCDGVELTTLIREREGYLNTPIVFVSGELDEDRQFAALDAGGDDFLSKPIRPTHLMAAVTNRVRRARVAAERTRRRRRRDATTGLHERSQLLDVLTEHLAAAHAAAHGGLVAVELHDVDRLRARGDLTAFDELLTRVGEFVVAHVPPGSMTARFGQAGFLVLAPTLDREALTALATELTRAAGDHRFGACAWAVQLHAGACAFGPDARESATALAGVERALDEARAGLDRVAVHGDAEAGTDSLGERISAALAAGSFDLAFQPVLPIRGASDPMYQALLRLPSDGHEYHAADLVPAAIQAGTIAAVDAWVVERCIGILAGRDRAGEPVCLIASQSLEGWDDVARRAVLSSRLAAAGIAADKLVLEFRCEAARANPSALTELMQALKQMGLGLALAGFGDDVLAAEWVANLPFAYIKIRADLPDAELPEVVRAAHLRGRRVIAPRIETLARARRLREAGVDLLQGNYFRPPGAEMEPADSEEAR